MNNLLNIEDIESRSKKYNKMVLDFMSSIPVCNIVHTSDAVLESFEASSHVSKDTLSSFTNSTGIDMFEKIYEAMVSSFMKDISKRISTFEDRNIFYLKEQFSINSFLNFLSKYTIPNKKYILISDINTIKKILSLKEFYIHCPYNDMNLIYPMGQYKNITLYVDPFLKEDNDKIKIISEITFKCDDKVIFLSEEGSENSDISKKGMQCKYLLDCFGLTISVDIII